MQYDIVYNDKSDLKNVINDEKNELYIYIRDKKFIYDVIEELLILDKIQISFFAYNLDLENIPERLFEITNLKILDLSMNKIVIYQFLYLN
jgi:hypothetical protein